MAAPLTLSYTPAFAATGSSRMHLNTLRPFHTMSAQRQQHNVSTIALLGTLRVKVHVAMTTLVGRKILPVLIPPQ